MSAHYLLDMHTTPITASEINDVRRTTSGSSAINGSFVIRVADEISLGSTPPATLSALISAKYAGLLAFYAGFTRINFDGFDDASGVNSATSTGVFLSERVQTSIVNGGAGILISNPVALTGAAPSQAIVVVEVATQFLSDTKTNAIERVYSELDPGGNATIEVSFNGGTSFLTVSDGAPFIIPVLDQGTSFVIRITNVALFKFFITSWSVIY